jgi:spermidine synthase
LTSSQGFRNPGGDWFFETEKLGYAQGLRITGRVFATRTKFQNLEIVDTDYLGRVLVLDGALQTSDRDEFMYHEMLIHPPVMTHPNPGRVLVVGGGDGGALRHVLQHTEVAEATQVEIDAGVVEACKTYMPKLSDGAFEHPRARLIIGDGVEYMRQNPAQFDVIVIDSTDPVGPAVELFEAPFYQNVARSLADDGLMVAQSSSPLYMREELVSQVQNMRRVFPIVRTYLGIVSGYPGTLWSYTIGSKRHDPLAVDRDSVASRLEAASIPTKYYSPDVHPAAFALPPFIAAIIG